MDRRRFLAGAAAGLAVMGVGRSVTAAPSLPSVLIFTKHLQFIPDYSRMAATAAEIGFDGLDLAVRKGGHVEPGNVARDLPRAVDAARAAGLKVGMITTGIEDAAHPHTRPVLEAAAAQGIRLYRIGGPGYDAKRPIPEQMDEMRGKLAALAELNRELGVCSVFQNHSGSGRIGAPIWDLWIMMEGLDPEHMAINFDLGHATIEGGKAWELHWRLTAPKVKAVTIKDFRWERNPKGEWRAEWCPVGEGMLQLAKFFEMMRESGFAGPISSHYEYEPRDAAGGKSDEALIAAMKQDLVAIRAKLTEAGW